MLANKIKFVTDKLVTLMPQKDASTFRSLMYEYVKLVQSGAKNLPKPNTNNANVNNLVTAILNNLSSEKMETNTDKTKKWYGYNTYYWQSPWWWNYWYYSWSPYYWWRWDPNPYDGINYVGASKKVGHSCNNNGTGALDTVLDSVVDIHSMNLNCDDNRLCNFNVQFTKAPIMNNAFFSNVANGNALLDVTTVDEDEDVTL